MFGMNLCVFWIGYESQCVAIKDFEEGYFDSGSDIGFYHFIIAETITFMRRFQFFVCLYTVALKHLQMEVIKKGSFFGLPRIKHMPHISTTVDMENNIAHTHTHNMW